MAFLQKAEHAFVLLMLLMARSLRGEQLVLPEGKEHSILCTASAVESYLITWVADDVPAGEGFVVGEEERVDDGMKGKRVIFTATANISNTNLKCVVTDLVESSNSFDALELTIIIQGTLPALDVQYAMGDQYVRFSWSPPFTHNITFVEPDISHYIVAIINMEDHSVLTVNTTDTEYLLQSEDCQLHQYQVEITAVNVVGMGEKYTSPTLTLDELSLSDDPIVSLGGESPVITFQVKTSCGQINFVFEVLSIHSNQKFTSDGVISEGETTLTLTSNDMQFNEHYQLTVTVDDSTKFHHTLSLSTFDVQNVEVTGKDNEYHIKCHFAAGAKARGCMIVLSHEGSGECEVNATRPDGTGEAVVKVTLPAGEYSVEVYDIEEEGTVDRESPAYTTTLSVSGASNSQLTGCGAREVEMASGEGTETSGSDGAVALGVGLSLAILLVAGLVAVVVVVAILIRKFRVPRKLGRIESGDSEKEGNEYFSPQSFLGPGRSTTETGGGSGPHDSPQQAIGESSPSNSRQLSPSQQSVQSNTTAETHISTHTTGTKHSLDHDSLPDSTTVTHNSPSDSATEATTEPQPPQPYIPQHLLPPPHSRESSASQESAPISTASTSPLLPHPNTASPRPVVPRQSNYVEVQHAAQRQVQSPPRTNESVLYSMIVPHTPPPPQKPHTSTGDVPQ